MAFVPLPNNTPFAVSVVAPVPPLLTTTGIVSATSSGFTVMPVPAPTLRVLPDFVRPSPAIT